jgi:putative oxidoreductase
MLADQGLPTIMAYGVYLTEIVAPILILIGLRTRLAALCMHAVFYLLCFWHTKDIFTLNEYGGWQLNY